MIASAVTRQTQTEWFASWFDSLHYHRLYADRDDHEAAVLVDRLIARLDPKGDASILDLGCGAGRHAKYLASKGFDVTGLDLSAESIRIARRSEWPNLRFVRGDMRQPFGTRAFDAVFNLFTSFGYFDDAADNLRVIQHVANALKTGGQFVLDYLNVHRAAQHLRADERIDREDVTYQLSRWQDSAHIFKRIAIHDRRAAAPIAFIERVAKLGEHDLRFMFELCRLRIDDLYGDYALAPFDPDRSPRLLVVATKG